MVDDDYRKSYINLKYNLNCKRKNINIKSNFLCLRLFIHFNRHCPYRHKNNKFKMFTAHVTHLINFFHDFALPVPVAKVIYVCIVHNANIKSNFNLFLWKNFKLFIMVFSVYLLSIWK